MEDVGQRVARRVRQLRLRAGLSLDGLAERTSVPSRTLGRVERGEVSPTVRTLARIAAGLGVDPIAFYYTEEAPVPRITPAVPSGALDPIIRFLNLRPPEDVARALRVIRAVFDTEST